MKNYFFKLALLVFATCLYSCTKSPEEKAQILFEESLKSELGQPELYEFIQMSKLDSAFTSLEEDRAFLDLKDSLLKNTRYLVTMMLFDTRDAKKKQERLKKEIEEYEQSFKPSFIGWHSNIDFRAENGLGGVKVWSVDAYFNEDLTQALGYSYYSLMGERKKHRFNKKED